MRRNDPRLKHACNIVQRRCTVNSGYDVLLAIDTRHISDMVDHLWQQTPTGYFIKSNVESFKLEVGEIGRASCRERV